MADMKVETIEKDDLAVLSGNAQFCNDVLNGLRMPQKAIPARYFYDRRGSELFEQITELPEYDPPRTEVDLMQSVCDDLAQRVRKGLALVEFGAGSLMKVGLLLDRLSVSHYVPIDISGDFLRDSARRISEQYPAVEIFPVEADFSNHVDLPDAVAPMPKLGFFPGSTIGNLVLRDAVDLLRRMHGSLGEGAQLLIGVDRVKDVDTLLAAYDDRSGTTAAFNMNLLRRINRELGGTIELDGFRHEARWNADAARIEMHLKAIADTEFLVAGHSFAMRADETIHTENSHKYTENTVKALLRAGGWQVDRLWTDSEENFFLILAEAMPRHIAP